MNTLKSPLPIVIPKILIVEDEALVSDDLAMRLNRLGYAVCGQADSFESAVADSDRLHPDLILMDIHLIGPQDGIETAIEIRRRSGTPVIS